jgi:hypothetical protein
MSAHDPSAGPSLDRDGVSSASSPAAPTCEGAPPAPSSSSVQPRRTVSRRAFVTRLGAALLAAPFVDLLLQPSRTRAATAAKRLIVFFNPNGTIPDRWAPAGTETSWTIPAGSVLDPFNGDYKAYKDKLVAIDGLEFKNVSNHAGGMVAMLTGSGGASDASAGMSVDQFVASKIGGTTRLKSLELGVETSAWGAGEQTRMCYSAAKVFAPPDDDPVSVYGRVFGGGSSSGGTVDAATLRRQSVIDTVKADLDDLSARLGAEERSKLDQHLTAVRELERQMGNTTTNTCSGGNPPAAIGKDINDNFPKIGKTQMDLLVAALACGATKVASLQWSFTVSPMVPSWLGIADQHHTLSHAGDGDAVGSGNFIKSEQWFASQFGYLLDQLQKTADPAGGTLLDSTLVLWAKEMGDARLHVCTRVPFVVAGGGYFKPGRFLNLKASAPSHTQLLVSICQAMGLTNETFGNAALGSGPLAGL